MVKSVYGTGETRGCSLCDRWRGFFSLNLFKLLELISAVTYIFYLPSHEEMSRVVYLMDGFELAIDVGMSLLVRLDETGQCVGLKMWAVFQKRRIWPVKFCPWDTQSPNQRDDWYESSNCNFTVPYFWNQEICLLQF